jgi:hypothetical protein
LIDAVKSSPKISLPVADEIRQGKKGVKLAIYHLTSGGNARNKILSGQAAKAQRDINIHAAVRNHRYSLKEIADYLPIHYTTVSKGIAKTAVSKT